MLSGVLPSGPLFQKERGGILTIKGIRQKVLELIRAADPAYIPRGHSTKKLAATLNYFQHMKFYNLKVYTGWQSPKVFIKHYIVQIEALINSGYNPCLCRLQGYFNQYLVHMYVLVGANASKNFIVYIQLD